MIDSIVAAKKCRNYLGNELNDYVELGQPKAENRYYAWRIPLRDCDGRRLGEVFVGYQDFTGVIAAYSTSLEKIKERLNSGEL